MISHKQERSFRIGTIDILDPENVHQVVSREIDPERSDMPLAKSPEPLPRAKIHPMREAEPGPLGPAENGKLL